MRLPEIAHETTLITPARAAALLKGALKVKLGSKAQVRTYSEDMRSQAWLLNGDPIIVGSNGQVLSGHLRLRACVEADTAFPALVITGIDPSTFETIDSVRRRTLGDVLAIRKEPKGRALAAALSLLWRYSQDDYVNPRKSPSAHALLQMLECNPDLRASLKLAEDVSRLASLGVAATMHYLFTCVDGEKANEFFDLLVQEELRAGPAFLLRSQLQNLKRERGTKSQGLIVGLFIKAWEAFRSNADMRQLRFVPGVDQAPQVAGLRRDALTGISHEVASAMVTATSEKLLSSQELEVEITEIAPEYAEHLLSRNDRNRGMAALVMEKYARDISAGNWLLNGQTIKIGISGRLLDGQHRLAACVRAGKPFPAIIVRGLDDQVFDTFDLGARRSMGDILKSRGEQNTSGLAAALRQLWLLESGLLQSRGAAPTVAEMLEVLEAHPEIRESVRLSYKVRDVTAPTVVVTLHYRFSRISSTRADWFLDRLSDGANLQPRHPVLVLRDQLMGRRRERKVSLADAERAAWIIKAWNAYVQDRSVSHIRWQQLGPRKEPFPEIASITAASMKAA